MLTTSPEAQETFTPDSQKSTFDKAKESVTDTADSIAASAQPGTFCSFGMVIIANMIKR